MVSNFLKLPNIIRYDSCCDNYFVLRTLEKIRKILRRFRRKATWCKWCVLLLKHFLISYLLFKSYDKGSVNGPKYLLTFMKYPPIGAFLKSVISTVVWNWLLSPPGWCGISLSLLDKFWYFKMDPSSSTSLKVIS